MKGSLKIKRGIYYAVINYKDEFGQYKQKWISTGLKERGNKKEAQKFLEEQLKIFNNPNFEKSTEPKIENDIIFVDYIKQFIDKKKNELSPAVYKTYINCWKVVSEFFGDKLKLKDVTYKHIEKFYEYLKKKGHCVNILFGVG